MLRLLCLILYLQSDVVFGLCSTAEEHASSCPSPPGTLLDRMARIDQMLSWAENRGLIWEKEVIVQNSSVGGVGLFAGERILPGEVFVSFPVEMYVTPPLFRLDPFLGGLSVFSEEETSLSQLEKLVVFAFFYMYCVDEDDDRWEYFGPYFAALPEDCETSLCLSDVELALLRDSSSDLYLMFLSWREMVMEMFQRLKKDVFDPNEDLFPAEKVSFDGFLRSFGAARSRLFSIDFAEFSDSSSISGISPEMFKGFVPVVDLANGDFDVDEKTMELASINAIQFDGSRLRFVAHREVLPGEEILGGWYPPPIFSTDPTTESAASRWFLRYGNFPTAKSFGAVCLGTENPDGGLLQICLSPKSVCSYVDGGISKYLEYKVRTNPREWNQELDWNSQRLLVVSLLEEVEDRGDAIDVDELGDRVAQIGTPFAESIRQLLEFEKYQFVLLYECLFDYYEKNFEPGET